MASIPTFPSLSANATMEQVIEHVAILQKTITFMMSSINTTNITEVGGWIADETMLAAENGTMGLSSEITAVNDLRIWAGDSFSAIAPFRVYEDGSLYASKATITGNITMTSGSIIWSGVNKPTYTPGEVGAIADNQLAVFNTLTNNGLARGLFLHQPTGELYLNADYINAGTIKAVNIDTTNLAAQRIYQPGLPNNYAVIGGTFGDMELYYNSEKYFSVYNELTGVSLKYKNTVMLGHNFGVTKPFGTWDFSSASHNIVAKYG